MRVLLEQQLELFPPPCHCVFCGKVVPQPFYVRKFFERMEIELPFCNENHANEYYLERIRETGL